MNILNLVSKEQKEILVGCLLGDAFMESTTKGKTWRLGMEQGRKQKDYLFKKHELIQNLSREMEKPRPKGNKYAFWTPRLACLKELGDAFYQKDNSRPSGFVKVVPKQIYEWLTPKSLAFWYMDDGSIKSKAHKLVYLNTQGFTLQDNKFLCEVLTKKFKLQTDIKISTDKRYEKNYCQIAIHGDSLEQLRKLIEPFLYPEVKKLPMPRTTKSLRGPAKK